MPAALDSQQGPAFTRSDAERVMLRLVRRAGLPEPLVNAHVCGLEVDFDGPAQGLVVEVDGHAFHGDRGAFEADRERDQILVASGLRVIRVTRQPITEQPLAVAVRIAQALTSGAR